MKSDPVIERIRGVRREISEEFNHDPQELVEHYRKMEKRFKDRILERTSTGKAKFLPNRD